MCIGFAHGDALYLSLAGRLGYSDPFSELPVLSVAVVAGSMTLPMTAWMLHRAMPSRAVREMSVTMPAVGAILLVLGALGALSIESLPLLMHGLMMPAMLVPMLLRRDIYSAPMRHALRSR